MQCHNIKVKERMTYMPVSVYKVQQ